MAMKSERELAKPTNHRSLRQPLAHLRSQGALAGCIAVLLTACQTPAVKERVVEVVKPVAVQPIKPADVPKLPAPLAKRPASTSSALDLALSKVCEWVAFGLKADPLLRVSAGLPQSEAAKYPECER